jgi:hypothetical protein
MLRPSRERFYPLSKCPMECRRIEVEELEQTTYTFTEETSPAFSFIYCISYRHPLLPEWILARGYWNDTGLWLPEGKFGD